MRFLDSNNRICPKVLHGPRISRILGILTSCVIVSFAHTSFAGTFASGGTEDTHAQPKYQGKISSTANQPVPFPVMGQGSISIGPLSPSIYGTSHLFGDWGGAQTWLQNHGVFVNLALNEEMAGNPVGGKRQDYALAGQVAAEADIDWSALAHIPGLWTHLLVVNGHGQNLARSLGDPVEDPEEVYGARGNVVAHLVAMYFDKSFLKDRIIFSAGVIPTGSMFNFDYLACNFMNVSVCANVTPGKYLNGGRDWPSGNLGAVLRVRPTERTYIMGGTFLVSPHSYNGGTSGWALNQDGMTIKHLSSQIEFGWNPSFGRHDLLGHYKIGAWYDSSTYNDLYEDAHGGSWQASGLPPRRQSGLWTGWMMFDQMLHRNGPGLSNGLIAIGGVGYAAGRISPMKFHEWIGFLDSGTPWGRPADTVGIMYQHYEMSRSATLQEKSSKFLGLPFVANNFGPAYGIQRSEQAFEAFYSVNLMPATNFQFDVQYLDHVGATHVFPNAVVFGGQLTTNF